ncbi:hypothetical protein HAX54_030403, partial [Datura stramonium]|nr:hypothetical protein [Datura stramonium]
CDVIPTMLDGYRDVPTGTSAILNERDPTDASVVDLEHLNLHHIKMKCQMVSVHRNV